MRLYSIFLATLGGIVLSAMVPDAAYAVNCEKNPNHRACPNTPPPDDPEPDPEPDPDPQPVDDITETGNNHTGNPTYDWMHGDVGLAFSWGWNGVGSHLIIVDDHTYANSLAADAFSGNLDGNNYGLREHGFWTSLQASLVAPGAGDPTDVDWGDTNTISHHYSLDISDLEVVNLSYGQYGQAGFNPSLVTLGTLGDSIVDEAHAGTAVFSKAAGNTNGGTVDGTITVRTPRPVRYQDYLNLQLIGAPGAIFVGALDGNGTVDNKASIASYSTIAGNNSAVQDMFLVVGVDSSLMGGLAGTSFAAPIISGYAAIIGDKYYETLSTISTSDPSATSAALVVDRLLETARTDTIDNYSVSVHGQGEADLSRALAPDLIPN